MIHTCQHSRTDCETHALGNHPHNWKILTHLTRFLTISRILHINQKKQVYPYFTFTFTFTLLRLLSLQWTLKTLVILPWSCFLTCKISYQKFKFPLETRFDVVDFLADLNHWFDKSSKRKLIVFRSIWLQRGTSKN